MASLSGGSASALAVLLVFDGGLNPSTLEWGKALLQIFFLQIYIHIQLLLPGPEWNTPGHTDILWILAVWRIVLVLHFQAPSDRIYSPTDTRVDSLLFGCMLALAHWRPVQALAPAGVAARGLGC